MIKLPSNANINSITMLFYVLDSRYLEDVLIPGTENIELDFAEMRFYDISSSVALLGKMMYWYEIGLPNGKGVKIYNIEQAVPFKYMQRMDFFELCGIRLAEDFQRHAAQNEFVEIKRIDQSTNTALISTQIADCLAPEEKDLVDPELTGIFDCIEYSVSELINNVKQHSRSYGFIAAQYYGGSDRIQIVIADVGIGIRQSFIETESPYSEQVQTDRNAIELALRPNVSSKMHGIYALGGAINAGVGLFLLKEICEAASGEFIVISGNACYDNNQWSELKHPYIGTFVCFSITRKKLKEFGILLENAKIKGGLAVSNDQNFSGIFR